jgi:hypothetical protein
MFRSEEEFRDAVEMLARGEVLPDQTLTFFCRACVVHNFDNIVAAAKSVGVEEPEEIADLANAAVEEMKQEIRAGALTVEIVADGEGFRFLTPGTRH